MDYVDFEHKTKLILLTSCRFAFKEWSADDFIDIFICLVGVACKFAIELHFVWEGDIIINTCFLSKYICIHDVWLALGKNFTK